MKRGQIKVITVSGFLLSTLLTGEYCFSSSEVPANITMNAAACAASLEGDQISHYLNKAGLSIQSSSFGHGTTKSILLESGGWGAPGLSMRAIDQDEAIEFVHVLLHEMNSILGANYLIENSSGHPKVKGLFDIYISPPTTTLALPAEQGSVQLQIQMEGSSLDDPNSKAFFQSLKRAFHLRQDEAFCPTCLNFDLKTREGRRAWGMTGFYVWTKNLSSSARQAMDLISGPDYRDILPYLRNRKQTGMTKIPKEVLDTMIQSLNDAISRGKIPQTSTLYRAVSEPFFDQVWNSLQGANFNGEIEVTDHAFSFTSLDEKFVEGWNKANLGGKGVILEIEAVAGLAAGYVDRGQYTDYAEIVLPMDARIFATQGYVDGKGQRRIRAVYRKAKINSQD
jgi:hypothetical protein